MGGVEIPETRYAITDDGVRIAYQARGDGPVDLVYVMGFLANFEIEMEDRYHARFIDGLAQFSRLVLFDKRGSGLSDRDQTPDLEMRADDLKAVLDEIGSERAVLYGSGEGGSLAAFFAATHPDRVLALVLHDAPARVAWAPDYPLGVTRDSFERDQERIAAGWGTFDYTKEFAQSEIPSRADDGDFVRWFARLLRHSASPTAALAFNEVWYATDVRAVLGSVQAPTLVIASTVLDPDFDPRAEARDIADRIPGARYLELQGTDYAYIYTPHTGVVVEAVREFVQSVRTEEKAINRVLSTVLFTDIVGSTEAAASLGDMQWKALLERHHEIVRALIGRYRGTEIATSGDGFLATFDGPARAVRCAQAITEAVQPLGLQVRAGLHTGEIETIDNTVGGLAVHIGARVGALAGPSEVVTTSTVKELVAGSGLIFEDRGEHEMKGIPDTWHLYRAVAQ